LPCLSGFETITILVDINELISQRRHLPSETAFDRARIITGRAPFIAYHGRCSIYMLSNLFRSLELRFAAAVDVRGKRYSGIVCASFDYALILGWDWGIYLSYIRGVHEPNLLAMKLASSCTVTGSSSADNRLTRISVHCDGCSSCKFRPFRASCTRLACSAASDGSLEVDIQLSMIAPCFNRKNTRV
jgi:hypothetical protein